jgi:hypothetical protein
LAGKLLNERQESFSRQPSVYQGSDQPFLAAVLDKTPHIMAVKKAKGEPVVIPARKKAKHRTAKILR